MNIYAVSAKRDADAILKNGLSLPPEQYNPEYLAAVIAELTDRLRSTT